ncbi:hypothetical protein [Actinokineospora inagensis]|uniref:hypothetical protein n=1 Tax=Actinokineospora inagensis TaxID=103730 RepID=UPI000414B162|nr:hypothetical protein [Actinokineospora inagensis]
MSADESTGTIGSAVGDFAALAARGGFEVNEHGGQALLNAVNNMIDWIDSRAQNFYELGQTAMLGSSTNATAMKPYLQQVATDKAGFVTQVKQLRGSLAAAAVAIQQAMANYRQTDQHVAENLT